MICFCIFCVPFLKLNKLFCKKVANVHVPAPSQQEVFNIESFNCNGKYESPFIALVG